MKEQIRITVISTYKEMESFFDEVSFEGVRLKVKTINKIDEIKNYIKENEKDTDVFLSRGATVRRIQENSSIPVVNVAITNFDLIKAIDNAKSYGEKKIGFLSYNEDKYDVKEIERILDVELKRVKYESTLEVANDVESIAKLGINTVIGGGMTPLNAERLGMNSVLLQSSKESIANAVTNAINIAKVRRIEKEKNARLNAILNSINQGIIVTDEKDIITLYNPSAEKIMKKKRDRVLGKNIVDTIPNTKMHEINVSGKAEIGMLQEINGEIIATSRIPIMLEQRNIGGVSTFEKSSNIQKIEKKIRENLHEKGLMARYNFDDIEVSNQIMQDIKILAKLYSKTDETILINGESGTGKELFAQSIHNESRRKNEPFVAVNCAAISENLLESELFGYEGGAFTGARKEGKPGLFELAHKGTIFLDEIGEISKHLQSSLLRVIQEKEVRRVGGENVIPIDIRIICATNRNLADEVEKGNFREDLYYRLNVFYINLLPLRERKEDIRIIAKKLIKEYPDKEEVEESVLKIIDDIPSTHEWKGNIRELDSIVKRAYLMTKAPNLYNSNLNKLLVDMNKRATDGTLKANINLNKDLKEIVGEIEKKVINYYINENYSMEEILEKLNISKSSYMRKKRS
ncbi:sigma 54-interacting transcriptional regulator [uncultured Clostridium sp.]|uniref:sigma 54-interacting transcriptional regulator n=1 Tax=uncultured Clostridium sp. TaxID=59620 RepID=UPI002620BB5A|nr:sigma 54-interacting transcriptional regulator [uncultured Clostridium sp.]